LDQGKPSRGALGNDREPRAEPSKPDRAFDALYGAEIGDTPEVKIVPAEQPAEKQERDKTEAFPETNVRGGDTSYTEGRRQQP